MRMNLEYTTILEMKASVESILASDKKVIDGWRENNWFVLVVACFYGKKPDKKQTGDYWNETKIKLRLPQ